MDENRRGFPQLDAEQESKIKAEVKQYFLSEFTDEEVEEAGEVIAYNKRINAAGDKNILHRSMGQLDYAINWMNFRGNDFIEMQITGYAKNYLAKVIFECDAPPSNIWNLKHRLVNTGDFQITGTEFLEQAEKFMEKLAKKGFIELNKYETATSQLNVAEWLNKNEYKFVDGKSQQDYEDIKANPDDYELFFMSSGEYDYLAEPFVFKKSEIDPDQMTTYIDARYDDGKHIKITNPEVFGLKGLMRFHLEKPVSPELAKPQ